MVPLVKMGKSKSLAFWYIQDSWFAVGTFVSILVNDVPLKKGGVILQVPTSNCLFVLRGVLLFE